jgi:hypothetical protein
MLVLELYQVNNAGMVLYTAIIVTVNMQLASVLTYWNWILHFCTWISITGWFFFVMLYGAMPLHISGQVRCFTVLHFCLLAFVFAMFCECCLT